MSSKATIFVIYHQIVSWNSKIFKKPNRGSFMVVVPAMAASKLKEKEMGIR